MTDRPPGHNRRSIRLKDYDYASDGAYFVTLCTQGMVCYLGEPVRNAERDVMHLSASGLIVRDAWLWLEQRYPYVFLDAFVVMPNHLHGILILSDGPVETFREEPHACALANEEQLHNAPRETLVGTVSNNGRKSLGRLIGAFKTVSTKAVNELCHTPGCVRWQRNYFERVIRTERELNAIREYIALNPARWLDDRYCVD